MAVFAGRYVFPVFGYNASGGLVGLPGASVLIRLRSNQATASLYTDRTKATAAANPLQTGVVPGVAGLDIDGNALIYADPGDLYEFMVTVGSVVLGPFPIGGIPTDPSEPGGPPAAGSVTDASVATNAAIAKSKLAALNIVDADVSVVSQGKVTGLATALAAKADDNAVLKLTGNQTKTGNLKLIGVFDQGDVAVTQAAGTQSFYTRIASGKNDAWWYFNTNSGAFESGLYTDRVLNFGYNRDAVGAKLAGEPMLFLQFETKFRNNSGTPFGSEFHLNFGRPSDAFAFNRPINVFMEHVSGATQISLAGSLTVTGSGDTTGRFVVPDGAGEVAVSGGQYLGVTLPASGLPAYIFVGRNSAGTPLVSIDNAGRLAVGGSGTGANPLALVGVADASVMEFINNTSGRIWTMGPKNTFGAGDFVISDYSAGIGVFQIIKGVGRIALGHSLTNTVARLRAHIPTYDNAVAGIRVTENDPAPFLDLGAGGLSYSVVHRSPAAGATVDFLRFETPSGVLSRVGKGGRWVTAVASPPVLADLVNGELALSTDASGNLIITSRVAGALKTATVTVA